MKKSIALIGVLFTLLWPAQLAAEDNHYADGFHIRLTVEHFPANRMVFLQPENGRNIPLPSENLLPAVELDKISAGGLEHLFNQLPPSGRMYGQIILWDETGNQRLSGSSNMVPAVMPARTMHNVQINAVFDACE